MLQNPYGLYRPEPRTQTRTGHRAHRHMFGEPGPQGRMSFCVPTDSIGSCLDRPCSAAAGFSVAGSTERAGCPPGWVPSPHSQGSRAAPCAGFAHTASPRPALRSSSLLFSSGGRKLRSQVTLKGEELEESPSAVADIRAWTTKKVSDSMPLPACLPAKNAMFYTIFDESMLWSVSFTQCE